jgi:hypothetical protein
VEILNSNSFEEAMLACYQYERYRVVIAFPTRKQAVEFAKYVHDLWQEGHTPGVSMVYMGRLPEIIFDNGSSIKICYQTIMDWCRATRCNTVLYYDDDAITKHVWRNILCNMIVSYEYPPNVRTLDGMPVRPPGEQLQNETSESLDEFLSSFTINT